MNSRHSSSPPPPPDGALSELLGSWRVDGTLPAGFTAEVHRRIRRSQPANASDSQSTLFATLSEWARGGLALLQRPKFAAAYVAAGILLGAFSGSRLGASRAPLDNTGATIIDAQVRYIASIDPYRMPPASQP
ncbi:MAG: hypothetical protein AB7O66_04790 [Limisphaerales bacterium]